MKTGWTFTRNEIRVLRVIQSQPTYLAELSRWFGMSYPGMHHIVSRLEFEGLIERHRSKKKVISKEKIIYITDYGKRILKAIEEMNDAKKCRNRMVTVPFQYD